MRKLILSMCFLTAATVAAVAAPVVSGPSSGSYSVGAGASAVGATRYRAFPTGAVGEHYLGVPDLGSAGNRVQESFSPWALGNNVEFEYIPASDKLVSRIDLGADNAANVWDRVLEYSGFSTKFNQLKGGSLPSALNFLYINVRSGGASSPLLRFENVKLDGSTLGSGTFDAQNNAHNYWTVTNYDFSNGFLLSGKISLTSGGVYGNNENARVEIGFGNAPALLIPVPAAALLGVLGMGVISALRRQFA